MPDTRLYVIRKRYKPGHLPGYAGPRTYYLREISGSHTTPCHVWTHDLSKAKVFNIGDGDRPPVYFTDVYMAYDMVWVKQVTRLEIIE